MTNINISNAAEVKTIFSSAAGLMFWTRPPTMAAAGEASDDGELDELGDKFKFEDAAVDESANEVAGRTEASSFWSIIFTTFQRNFDWSNRRGNDIIN